MISIRKAYYCNLKLLLIFLVVFGHMIEPKIEDSRGLNFIYWFIYIFHMPMFAFLSGLFVKSGEQCLKQGLRLLKICGILQLVVIVVTLGKQNALIPNWYLWYLFSSGLWMLLGWLWFRYGKAYMKIPVILCAVILGCLAGYLPWINKMLSLSRTIVFFPYFFAGILYDPEKLQKRAQWRYALLLMPLFVLATCWWRHVPVSFLYQADPYGEIACGWIHRLIAYVMGAGISWGILCCIPRRRFWFTKLGGDTMLPYLIHGPVVLLLQKIPTPWYLLPVLSFVLILFIYQGSGLFYKLYGITSVATRRRKRKGGS